MDIFRKRKGLLKKFNLLDITLLIFLILIVVILYNTVFPFKSFKKLHDVPEEKWMLVDMIVPSDMEWMHKYIVKGDKQRELQDKVFAEVVDVYYSRESGGRDRLMVKLRILVALEPGQYPVFGRHPVRIGAPIVFQTEDYILTGYIAGIEKTSDENKK